MTAAVELIRDAIFDGAARSQFRGFVRLRLIGRCRSRATVNAATRTAQAQAVTSGDRDTHTGYAGVHREPAMTA